MRGILADMNMKHTKILGGVGAAVVLIAIAAFLAMKSPAPLLPTENNALQEEGAASSTQVTQGALPRTWGPMATLPPGAIAIDEYAFTDKNGLQFLSVTSTSTLIIPDADAATFHRITEFAQSPDPGVVRSCGIAGKYAFYADKKRVYFYQVWLAPKFRTSRVEVVADAAPETFKILTPTSFLDGERALHLDYEVATSTCLYGVISG